MGLPYRFAIWAGFASNQKKIRATALTYPGTARTVFQSSKYSQSFDTDALALMIQTHAFREKPSKAFKKKLPALLFKHSQHQAPAKFVQTLTALSSEQGQKLQRTVLKMKNKKGPVVGLRLAEQATQLTADHKTLQTALLANSVFLANFPRSSREILLKQIELNNFDSFSNHDLVKLLLSDETTRNSLVKNAKENFDLAQRLIGFPIQGSDDIYHPLQAFDRSYSVRASIMAKHLHHEDRDLLAYDPDAIPALVNIAIDQPKNFLLSENLLKNPTFNTNKNKEFVILLTNYHLIRDNKNFRLFNYLDKPLCDEILQFFLEGNPEQARIIALIDDAEHLKLTKQTPIELIIKYVEAVKPANFEEFFDKAIPELESLTADDQKLLLKNDEIQAYLFEHRSRELSTLVNETFGQEDQSDLSLITPLEDHFNELIENRTDISLVNQAVHIAKTLPAKLDGFLAALKEAGSPLLTLARSALSNLEKILGTSLLAHKLENKSIIEAAVTHQYDANIVPVCGNTVIPFLATNNTSLIELAQQDKDIRAIVLEPNNKNFVDAMGLTEAEVASLKSKASANKSSVSVDKTLPASQSEASTAAKNPAENKEKTGLVSMLKRKTKSKRQSTPVAPTATPKHPLTLAIEEGVGYVQENFFKLLNQHIGAKETPEFKAFMGKAFTQKFVKEISEPASIFLSLEKSNPAAIDYLFEQLKQQGRPVVEILIKKADGLLFKTGREKHSKNANIVLSGNLYTLEKLGNHLVPILKAHQELLPIKNDKILFNLSSVALDKPDVKKYLQDAGVINRNDFIWLNGLLGKNPPTELKIKIAKAHAICANHVLKDESIQSNKAAVKAIFLAHPDSEILESNLLSEAFEPITLASLVQDDGDFALSYAQQHPEIVKKYLILQTAVTKHFGVEEAAPVPAPASIPAALSPGAMPPPPAPGAMPPAPAPGAMPPPPPMGNFVKANEERAKRMAAAKAEREAEFSASGKKAPAQKASGAATFSTTDILAARKNLGKKKATTLEKQEKPEEKPIDSEESPEQAQERARKIEEKIAQAKAKQKALEQKERLEVATGLKKPSKISSTGKPLKVKAYSNLSEITGILKSTYHDFTKELYDMWEKGKQSTDKDFKKLDFKPKKAFITGFVQTLNEALDKAEFNETDRLATSEKILEAFKTVCEKHDIDFDGNEQATSRSLGNSRLFFTGFANKFEEELRDYYKTKHAPKADEKSVAVGMVTLGFIKASGSDEACAKRAAAARALEAERTKTQTKTLGLVAQ